MELKDVVLLAMYEEDLKKSPRIPRCSINSELLCIYSKTFAKVIDQLAAEKYIENPKMQVWAAGMPEFIVLYDWEMTESGKEYIRNKLKERAESGVTN